MRPHPRFHRTRLWVPLAVAIMGAGASLGCVALDRRPPWATEAYARSVLQVEAAASKAPAATGILHVGWARLAFPLPERAPLAGYGERINRPHASSADANEALYVRAFALEVGHRRAIIFTADLLLIERPLADLVRARIDAAQPGTQTFFTASHTHSGPGGYARGKIFEMAFGTFDREILDALAATFTRAGLLALENRAPAQFEAVEVVVDGAVANRIERNGPVDDTLVLFRFDRADGRRAALYSFGCHPTTQSRDSLSLSADYPGDVARAIEGVDVEVLAFAAGGVGSAEPADKDIAQRLIPKVREALRLAHPPTRQARHAPRMKHTSHAHIQRVPRARERESHLAFTRVTLPFPPVRYRFSDALMLPAPLVSLAVGFDRFDLGALVLNEAGLLFVPAEMSGELTRAARRAAHRNGFKTLAVLPFDGTYAGYVGSRRAYDLPDEAVLPLHRYETRTLSFLGPWGGDLIANLSLRLLSGVRARARQEPSDGGW
ncbi:MAG: neutral/alkaline non-lysosomal ceramidase N-terminal domain-containing protein [Deltaproteobacteria bacterium]|nr:neutral/alkaline non-lysosomal ceramidase N-terminal domain-containing protein [Deltaproteobacteria bacterium]